MGIEATIAENTSAIKELIGVWSKLLLQGQNINARVETGEVTTVTAGTVKVKVAEAPKPVATPAPTPAVVAVEATALPVTAVASPSEVSYDQVSKAITDKAKTSRETVVALLAKFGAKKGTELKAEQYADFLKEIAL